MMYLWSEIIQRWENGWSQSTVQPKLIHFELVLDVWERQTDTIQGQTPLDGTGLLIQNYLAEFIAY